jgi:class 3 adenylate cyclase
MGLDIQAVAEAIGLDSFALLAVQVQGPVAVAFAASHPGLVSQLILCQAAANNADSHQAALLKTQNQIRVAEAELGVKLPYDNPWSALAPQEDIELVDHLTDAAYTRMRWTGNPVALQWNARQHMGRVAAPTLLLCPRSYPVQGQEMMLAESRELAAGIATSQMRTVDGTYLPYFADHEDVLDAIDGFLKPTRTPERLSGFRTVVFTDIVDSTRFMSDVGDEEGRKAMRAVEERVADLADQHGGRVIKNLGDGSLVSFSSNTAALQFALDVQDAADPESLQLRVGMAAGEPIQESGDIHGAVVAYASRVADLGGAGEIIASEGVRQLAMGKGFEFTSMGQHELKGFDEPAIIWKVSPPAT